MTKNRPRVGTVAVSFVLLFCFSIQGNAMSALEEYLARDHEVKYSVRYRGEQSGLIGATIGSDIRYVAVNLTSQVWQGNELRHVMYMILPEHANPNATHAYVILDGGKWKERFNRPPLQKEMDGIKDDLDVYQIAANYFNTPIVLLRHVPHQILYGEKEDGLIAYTFDRMIETGDADWPLLLPMTQAVMAGMDAVQAIAKSEWDMDIQTFTIAGGSKRGWTSLLAALSDETRVTAVTSAVFDIVNIEEQLAHQLRRWGEYSDQVEDYVRYNVFSRLDTENGHALLEAVDPFANGPLHQPSLFVTATNDLYWPLDAPDLYLDEFGGDSAYLLYLPNEGHVPRIDGFKKIFESSAAINRHAAFGTPLPKITSRYRRSEGDVDEQDKFKMDVQSSVITPREVKLWTAISPGSDFRQANWSSRPICGQVCFSGDCSCKEEFRVKVNVPEERCVAQTLELRYEDEGGEYSFFTRAAITGPDTCLTSETLLAEREAKKRNQSLTEELALRE